MYCTWLSSEVESEDNSSLGLDKAETCRPQFSLTGDRRQGTTGGEQTAVMERAAVVLVLVVTTTAQDLVRVVQEVNETTTLSCFYPPQWDSCSFVKDPGHNMQVLLYRRLRRILARTYSGQCRPLWMIP